MHRSIAASLSVGPRYPCLRRAVQSPVHRGEWPASRLRNSRREVRFLACGTELQWSLSWEDKGMAPDSAGAAWARNRFFVLLGARVPRFSCLFHTPTSSSFWSVVVFAPCLIHFAIIGRIFVPLRHLVHSAHFLAICFVFLPFRSRKLLRLELFCTRRGAECSKIAGNHWFCLQCGPDPSTP